MCAVSKTPWVTTYIGLGANVGDREYFLQQALLHLRRTEGFIVTRISSWVETEPVGPIAQDLFLNGVVEGKTTLSPEALFAALKAIEKRVGRIRRQMWGPREIDLDLLFYGDVVMEKEDLVLPHPRLHERDFVLVPLSELCPTHEHPKLKKRIQQLLRECHIFDASHPKPYSIANSGEAVQNAR